MLVVDIFIGWRDREIAPPKCAAAHGWFIYFSVVFFSLVSRVCSVCMPAESESMPESFESWASASGLGLFVCAKGHRGHGMARSGSNACSIAFVIMAIMRSARF